jgi:tRNA-dihydrouridine synthase
MGCPYPMVTGKRMGAGLLPNPALIADLLEGAFKNSALKISVKCRLGLEDSIQFEELIPIFNNYPLEEIIIHPRIGKQQYKGEVDREAFAKYAPQLKHSVCYNGDILTVDALKAVQKLYPTLDKVMIGRGVLANPFLLSELRNEELTVDAKTKMLRNFHLSLIEHCKKKYSGDLHFLKRMEELWEYHFTAFEDGRKVYKQIRKSRTLAQYEEVVFKAISDLQ